MKALLLLVFCAGLCAFGVEERKAGIVEKTYDVTDITLPGWKPPLPSGKGVAGFIAIDWMPPTLSNVTDYLKNRVRPETWDKTLDTKFTEQPNSRILIRQKPEIHEQIAAFLAAVRQAAAAPIGSVTPLKNPVKVEGELEVRIYSLPRETDSSIMETMRNDLQPKSWENPACFADGFGTKNGCIILIGQTKAMHDLLKPFLAKAKKRDAK
jgi:hypothetical protein